MPFSNESLLERCFNSVLFRLCCGLAFLVVGLLLMHFSTLIFPYEGLAWVCFTLAAGFIAYEACDIAKFVWDIVRPAWPSAPTNDPYGETFVIEEPLHKVFLIGAMVFLVAMRLMVFGIYAAVGWATYTFMNSG